MTQIPEHATILVVDDEPAIYKLVKAFLEHEGYTVVTAGDAKTAIRIYEEHADEVALLLTDLRMPGMTGLELADRALQRTPQLKVLFIGSDRATRGFGCIGKPFTRAELISKVGQV